MAKTCRCTVPTVAVLRGQRVDPGTCSTCAKPIVGEQRGAVPVEQLPTASEEPHTVARLARLVKALQEQATLACGHPASELRLVPLNGSACGACLRQLARPKVVAHG